MWELGKMMFNWKL